MMKRTTSYSLIALVLLSSCISSPRNNKASRVNLPLSVISQLHVIASNYAEHYLKPNSLADKRVRRIIGRVNTIGNLEQIALLCNSIAWPQEAGDEHYDAVFEHAMWLCVEKIACVPGQEAALALSALKPVIGPDAHPSEIMDGLIEKQGMISNQRVRGTPPLESR